MKCIIAGSRTIKDYGLVIDAIDESGFEIDEVVSGTADGVDKLGERWAMDEAVHVQRFPADWKKHGRKAGMLRNEEMIEYVQQHFGGAIFVWDGISVGTKGCIRLAKARLQHEKIFIKVI